MRVWGGRREPEASGGSHVPDGNAQTMDTPIGHDVSWSNIAQFMNTHPEHVETSD